MIRPASFGFNPDAAESNKFASQISSFGRISNQEISDRAVIEFDTMVSKLRNHNINVHVFQDSSDPIKPDAVFSNNWISTTPSGHVVVYPMRNDNRHIEIRPDIVDHLVSLIPAEVRDSMINPPIINLTDKRSTPLEGTGSIVFDHANRKAYACRSERTSENLLKQLCEYLEYDLVIFNAKDVAGFEVYHTNVVMAVCESFAILAKSMVEEGEEKDQLLRNLWNGKRVIEISDSQVKNFSGNCFEVRNAMGEKVFICSSRAWSAFTEDQQSFIQNQVQTVCQVDIPVIESIGGGSARCMITGIYF